MRYLTLLILLLIAIPGLLAQKEAPQSSKLNYFNLTQVSLLIGEESEDQQRKAMIPSFQTTNGIRIGSHWGFGLGVGVEPYEYVAFPVFISGYYFLNNKKTSPYCAFKGGYAFANSHKKIGNYYYNGEYDNKGGLMFNPEIGVRFKVSGFDLTLSGGYRFQRLESRVTADGIIYTYKHRVDYKRTSVTLGIIF